MKSAHQSEWLENSPWKLGKTMPCLKGFSGIWIRRSPSRPSDQPSTSPKAAAITCGGTTFSHRALNDASTKIRARQKIPRTKTLNPTLCDGVFVGNNANVLGNITVGQNSRVGAGSVVLSDVPPNSTVVGVPAHIVYRNGQRVLITDPHDVKDPLSDALIALSARVEELEDRLGAHVRRVEPFATEEAERSAYREELERLQDYVSMGEGI